MSDLLPCPMCGSDAEIERMGTARVSMIISCTDCGLSLESGETEIGQECRWNTRATPQGYKLVPVEPTDAMLKSAFGGDDELLIGHADIAENAKSIYKAMIEAAD